MRRYGSRKPSRKAQAVALLQVLVNCEDLTACDVPGLARSYGMSEESVRAMIAGQAANRRRLG